jgi:hypothetical protein
MTVTALKHPRSGDRSRNKAPSWKEKLTVDDFDQLSKWIELSGMECVARVAAALTLGSPGNVRKTDSGLLLELARRLAEHPLKSTHALSKEIAHEANTLATKRNIKPESLAKQLERAFSKNRTKWILLAQRMAHQHTRTFPGSEATSAEEFRAIGRITDTLPEAIDPYDLLLSEARRLRPEKLAAIKKLGRPRGTVFLHDAIKLQMERTTPVNGKIPRGLLDLIEPHLGRHR